MLISRIQVFWPVEYRKLDSFQHRRISEDRGTCRFLPPDRFGIFQASRPLLKS